MKKYKFFTLNELVAANEIAKKRNYNRQLIDDIVDFPFDSLFPITLTLLHEHACGVKVDPHVRCMIGVPGGSAFIDCDMNLFNSLSETFI